MRSAASNRYHRFSLIVLGVLLLWPATSAWSEEPPTLTVEQLTEKGRKSVVVIRFTGRDGKQQGLGSGVIVDENGLIATNLHVIGEARPISVELADGKIHDVTAVEAFDKHLDLAVVRIDVKGLPALPLGDSDSLKQGQPVVALGNPHGLKHSVVTGVVSGRQEIDGNSMIQLAIPIESGNSGGPLLDMQGRVHGFLTMKSLITDNLGFAMPSNVLKPMLANPHPTLMSRWLTIGALDPKEWEPLFGARWRQRAGRLFVEGLGVGFGGRSLCLSQQPVPTDEFELAVTVKLDDEEGAAGLAFCSNGSDVHYGFYPTAGKLRLSRFDGPDVFAWTVLVEKPSEHYRRGDWNALKVKFQKGKIQCFVNGHLAIEATDGALTGGKVGLAKFRTTQAEFRGFRVAKELPAEGIPAETVTRIEKITTGLNLASPSDDATVQLAVEGSAGLQVLREQAKKLEQQAQQLKQLALTVHEKRVQAELIKLLSKPEDEIDLFHCALMVAWLDNDEVDIEASRTELVRLAEQVKQALPKDADAEGKLQSLNKFLFDEQGFHGSRGDYYHKSNSYVNEVLDDREGLPITLSVVYMELARILGVKVVGVGFPSHFLVRHEPDKGEGRLLDVFEKGKVVTPADAEALMRRNARRRIQDADLAAVTKKIIIVRMLHNLMSISQQAEDHRGMLRYLNTMLAVNPELGQERFMRGVLHYQMNRRAEAVVDADWLLEHRPEGVDLEKVNEFRQVLEREK